MSIYAVNKVCRRVVAEPELRASAGHRSRGGARGPPGPPLSDEEVALLLAGDIGRLSRLGANNFLLSHLARFELLGMTLPEHGRKMRAEYAAERAAWAAERA